MKPVFEYQDYRACMQDYYEDRKKKSAFTWRDFSKAAGFASPSYLKLVCDGKSSLSRVGIPKVAAAMGLTGADYDYFVNLVEFGNAKDDKKKTHFFNEMTRIASEQRIRVLNADTFAYYDSAVNSIVRELAPLMKGALPNEISKQIKHSFSAQHVRESLAFLVKAGLLREVGVNAYEQTDKAITGSGEAIPLAIRSMNRQMIDLARESLDIVDSNERNVSGVTMGVNADTFKQISDELNACRKKIIAIANKCDNIDQVYRLNLQLFPLTEKV
ncbi:TIGR02147 family protein [Fibrobacter sp. UWEL]|uniref:TIGR02147 family protein n=1 Tax=Fibrobacter sp. UWEL TaxID=1896209 RepID=UPI00090FDEDB|nr:TIGR02147 family protein [Fibrobacter sp. UWEL]SHL06568.1 TIGR02147 family protein [Fibrobacter sp. UWEL]